MYVTVSSIVNACILDSVLILIFCPILKTGAVLRKAGTGCGILLLMCMVLRMYFPVEFGFMYNVRIERIWPSIYGILIYEVVQGKYTICVWDILMYIWAAGAVFQFGRKFLSYRKLKNILRFLPSKSLGSFQRENGLEDCKDEKLQVICTGLVSTPCLTGLKRGYILMPEEEYTKSELAYIIGHERMHYRRKDNLKKILIDILCTVFWWNPVFIYLENTVFHMLEISNDAALTEGMSGDEKVEYMQCLANVAAKIKEQELPFSISFSKNSVRELKQRLCLVGARMGEQKRFRRGMIALVMVLMCLSFSIIVEPFTEAPEGIPMTAENTYLIQNGDLYDVYVDGKFLFTTDDVFPFQGVTIYKNKEEIENE